MFSINTNQAGGIALASLTSVSTQVNQLENETSTGLKVSGAQDNASVFAVAQGIRANLKGFDAVNTSLQNAQSVVSTAITGATEISNVLNDVTKTLGYLANGSISDQQRQAYTVQFLGQLTEIQNALSQSSYDGVNMIGWDLNDVGKDGGNYPTAQSLQILTSPDGGENTLQSQNLLNGLSSPLTGRDGFLGFMRVGYWVGSTAYQTSNDLVTSNIIYGGPVATNPNFVSRSEIQQNEALAALAPLSSLTSAFYTSPSATVGVPSVFNSALAVFSQEVGTVLGNLAQDSNNIQSQVTFNQSLSDTYTDGLGNLVDANLAIVSAQLTAAQTRQQLATQTLNIANAAPDILTTLFSKAS